MKNRNRKRKARDERLRKYYWRVTHFRKYKREVESFWNAFGRLYQTPMVEVIRDDKLLKEGKLRMKIRVAVPPDRIELSSMDGAEVHNQNQEEGQEE